MASRAEHRPGRDAREHETGTPRLRAATRGSDGDPAAVLKLARRFRLRGAPARPHRIARGAVVMPAATGTAGTQIIRLPAPARGYPFRQRSTGRSMEPPRRGQAGARSEEDDDAAAATGAANRGERKKKERTERRKKIWAFSLWLCCPGEQLAMFVRSCPPPVSLFVALSDAWRESLAGDLVDRRGDVCCAAAHAAPAPRASHECFFGVSGSCCARWPFPRGYCVLRLPSTVCGLQLKLECSVEEVKLFRFRNLRSLIHKGRQSCPRHDS